MKLDRVIALKRDAIDSLRDIDGQARTYGLLHDDILTLQRKVYDRIAKTPAWCKAFVQGYAQRQMDSWFERDLIYCHVAPDGTRYTMRKDLPAWAIDVRPLYDANRGAEISTWPSAHFWPNGKPFAEPTVY